MSTETAAGPNVRSSSGKALSRRRSSLARQHSRSVLIALTPGLLALTVFFGIPIIGLIRTSLSSWTGIGAQQYVGLKNYESVFADPSFLTSLLKSLELGVGASIGICLIATVLGALVSANVVGAQLYRMIWFLPAIAPPSAVAVFWALSVQPTSGVVNAFLGFVGIGRTHAWLASPTTALGVVIGVAVWQGIGFAFLVILGAMEEVPVSAQEAAAIDGAGPMLRFFSITLPLIRPVLSMILLLEVIWAFNGFTLVWGLTKGGPGDGTLILPVLVYKDAFQFGNFGPASAISLIGGIFLLGVGFIGHWLGSRKGVDE